MALKYGVAFTIVDDLSTNRAFLVQNKHSKEWMLPGGCIDKGETTLEAASRELHEEAGLKHIGLEFNYSNTHNAHFFKAKFDFGKLGSTKRHEIFGMRKR